MNHLMIVRMGEQIDLEALESDPFDVEATIAAITALPGVSNGRRGVSNTLFECDFNHSGWDNIVRLDSNAHAVSAYGIGEDSLFLAMALHKALGINLRIFDTNYTFDLAVHEFDSVEDLLEAVDEADEYEED